MLSHLSPIIKWLIKDLFNWKPSSTNSASKVLPACSMLLLTLATRACLAVGGLATPPPAPAKQLHELVNSSLFLDSNSNSSSLLASSNPNGLSVLNPLAPHWQLLTEPGAWLEATIQVKKSNL